MEYNERFLYTYEVYTLGQGFKVKDLVELDEMEQDKAQATMFHMIHISRA